MRLPVTRLFALAMLGCAAPAPNPGAARGVAAPYVPPAATPEPPAEHAPPPAAASSPFGAALGRARRERARAANILAPRYSGNGRKESVLAFIGDLAPWLEQKKEAVGEAERDYLEAIRIATTPEQKVDALSEVAPLWLDLVDDCIRVAPLPAEAHADPDVMRNYEERLDVLTDPFRKRAMDYAEECVDLAIASNVASAAAQRCIDLRDRVRRADASTYQRDTVNPRLGQ